MQLFHEYTFFNMGMHACSIMITIFSFFIIWISRSIDPKGNHFLMNIVGLNMIYTLCFFVEEFLKGNPNPISHGIVFILVTAEFVLPVFMAERLIMYQAHQLEEAGRGIYWRKYIYVMIGIYMLTIVINFFMPFIFYIDENNLYQEAAFIDLSNVLSMIIAGLTGVIIYMYISEFRKSDIIYTICYMLFPSMALIVVTFYEEIDLMEYAVTIAVFLIAMLSQTSNVARYMENENTMMELKNELLITQLRPHFLYNALSSMSQLCKYDPEQAAQMTQRFADFVGKNMEDVKNKEPIPFVKELEYIKNYISIEQMRFGEDLAVHYRIEETDFFVPPLVVQPIIENSIKHGLGGREEGGMIIIATQKYPGGHILTITDDGVGFDQKAQKEKMDDGRVHIGTKSVKERLAEIAGSQLIIKSTPGKGTTVMIIIPDSYGLA